jgi:carboxylesterase type B
MTREKFTIWTNDVVDSGHAAQLRKYYTAELYGTLKRAFVYLLTDADNGCPTRRVALATGSPTYKYLSTHVLVNDPVAQKVLAAHGTDVTLIYDDTWYDQTPAESALSLQMSTYFTNFAKTGDPNLPAVPGLPTWETYTAGDERYMEFADTSVPRTGGYHVAQCKIADQADVFQKCGNLCHWFTHKNMAARLEKFLRHLPRLHVSRR